MESNAVRGQVVLAASDFQQASSSEQQIPVLLGLTLFSAAGLGGIGAGALDPQAWVPFVLVATVLAIVLAFTPRDDPLLDAGAPLTADWPGGKAGRATVA